MKICQINKNYFFMEDNTYIYIYICKIAISKGKFSKLTHNYSNRLHEKLGWQTCHISQTKQNVILIQTDCNESSEGRSQSCQPLYTFFFYQTQIIYRWMSITNKSTQSTTRCIILSATKKIFATFKIIHSTIIKQRQIIRRIRLLNIQWIN